MNIGEIVSMLEELVVRVSLLEKSDVAFQNNVTAIQNAVSALQSDIATLQSDVSALRSDVDALKTPSTSEGTGA